LEALATVIRQQLNAAQVDRRGVRSQSLPYRRRTPARQATIARRTLLNAMFYATKTGCGWEWLPHDFPKWKTVYHYFRLWRLLGG
jgi:transposase